MRHRELVDAIVLATQTVFETMLGQSAAAVKDSVEDGNAESIDGVAALVGIAGEWEGSGIVSCSGELACKLVGQMLQSRCDRVSEPVLDGMGEIANMVIGHAKFNLEGSLGPMRLSIPTVVHGSNFATRVMGKHEWSVVTFDCGGAALLVQVTLAKRMPG